MHASPWPLHVYVASMGKVSQYLRERVGMSTGMGPGVQQL